MDREELELIYWVIGWVFAAPFIILFCRANNRESGRWYEHRPADAERSEFITSQTRAGRVVIALAFGMLFLCFIVRVLRGGFSLNPGDLPRLPFIGIPCAILFLCGAVFMRIRWILNPTGLERTTLWGGRTRLLRWADVVEVRPAFFKTREAVDVARARQCPPSFTFISAAGN